MDDTGVSPTVLPPGLSLAHVDQGRAGRQRHRPGDHHRGGQPHHPERQLADHALQGLRRPAATSVRYSAFAGDPSAKPSEVRAQLAQGWIKRVTNALNPFDARVDDFVSSPGQHHRGHDRARPAPATKAPSP